MAHEISFNHEFVNDETPWMHSGIPLSSWEYVPRKGWGIKIESGLEDQEEVDAPLPWVLDPTTVPGDWMYNGVWIRKNLNTETEP